MAVSIGTVVGYLRLQDDLTAQLRTASLELITFQQKAERVASTLTRVGTALSIGVTAPIVAVGKASVEAFGEFERRMKVVQAVSETSADKMHLLEQAALTMGRTTQFSAAQAAEALGELAKAGFTAGQAAEALPRVLQLATAADLSMADAAVISANAVKTFGLEVKDLGKVNDVLAKAAAATTIDVADLRNSLKYIGPIAHTAGLGISETVAALGVLGDQGIKASIAGTGLRGTMASLLAPTKRARDVMHEMGIESFVADGKFIGLTKAVRLIEDNIHKLGGEAEQAAGLLAIFGRWAGPSISALVDRGASAISAMNVQLDMSGGFAERTAQIMNEGLLMTLRHMRNAIEVAGIALGRVLAPAFAALAEAVWLVAGVLSDTVIPAFDRLPVVVKVAVGAVVALGLAIPPVLLTLGLLSYALAAMGEGVTLLTSLLPAWARGATAAAAANTALATSTAAVGAATKAAASTSLSQLAGGTVQAAAALGRFMPVAAGVNETLLLTARQARAAALQQLFQAAASRTQTAAAAATAAATANMARGTIQARDAAGRFLPAAAAASQALAATATGAAASAAATAKAATGTIQARDAMGRFLPAAVAASQALAANATQAAATAAATVGVTRGTIQARDAMGRFLPAASAASQALAGTATSTYAVRDAAGRFIPVASAASQALATTAAAATTTAAATAATARGTVQARDAMGRFLPAAAAASQALASTATAAATTASATAATAVGTIQARDAMGRFLPAASAASQALAAQATAATNTAAATTSAAAATSTASAAYQRWVATATTASATNAALALSSGAAATAAARHGTTVALAAQDFRVASTAAAGYTVSVEASALATNQATVATSQWRIVAAAQAAAAYLSAAAQDALALRLRALAAAQTFLANNSILVAARTALVTAALRLQTLATGALALSTGALSAAIGFLGLTAQATAARIAIVSGAMRAWAAVTAATTAAVGLLGTALRGLLVSFLAFAPVIAAVTAGFYGLFQVFRAFRDSYDAWKAGNLLEHLMKRDDENFIRRFWLSWTSGAKQAAASTDEVAERQERLNLLFNRLSGKQLAKDLGELEQVWRQMQQAGLVGEEQMRAVVDEVRRLDPELKKVSPALRALVAEFERLNAAKPDFGGLLANAGTPVQQLAKARQILSGLTDEVRRNIDAQIAMGKSSNEDIVRGLEGVEGAAGVTTGVVALYRLGLEDTTRTTKKFAKESNDLFEQFSGAKGIREARQQIEAMAKAGVSFGSLTREALESAWESFKKLRDQFAAAGRSLPADVAEMGRSIEEHIRDPLIQGAATFVAMRDKAIEAKQAIQAAFDSLTGKQAIADGARAVQVLGTAIANLPDAQIKFGDFDAEALRAELAKVEAGIVATRRAGEPIPQQWLDIVSTVKAALEQWEQEIGDIRGEITGLDRHLQQLSESRERTAELSERLAVAHLTGIKREFAELEIARDREIAQIVNNGEIEADEKQRQIRLVNEYYNTLATGLNDKEASARIGRINASVDALADGFRTLAEITDGAMGRIFTSLGELMGILNLVNRAFEGFRETFRTLGKDGKERWDFGALLGKKGLGDAIAGWQQLAATVMTAAGALEQATDVAGRGNRAMRGAITGAQIGTQILPGWGTAIGAGIGALVGALRHPRWEQEIKNVGKDYGVTISREFAEALEADAKTRFNDNRQAAKIFNLAGIIQEGGGLTAENFGKMTARLRDVFSMLETGAFTGAQAVSVLDENWRTFVDFLGGNVSPALKEIIQLNDRFGTQSKEIAEYTSANARSALEGIGGFIEMRGEILTALDEARKKLGDADSKQEVKSAQTEIAKLQAQLDALPIASQSAASAIGASLFGVMDRLTRNGESMIAVFKDMAPTITSWQKQLEDAGFVGGAAFDRLRGMAALAGDTVAGPVLQAIEQLTAGLTGMNNADILTPEIYQGLTAEVTALVEQLQAQGHTTAEIYPFIASSLQTIWELQQDYHYEVDATTQKLLDEAEAAGVVGDAHRSVQEQMLLGINRMADAAEGLAHVFGVVLPSDMEKAAAASGDYSTQVQQDWQRIDPTIDVHYNVPDLKLPKPKDITVNVRYKAGEKPEGLSLGGVVGAYGMGGTVVSMADYKARGGRISQYLQTGGKVAAAALLTASLVSPVYAAEGKAIAHPGGPRGTDTVPAWLTPNEFVQPVARVQQYRVEGMEAIRQGRATIVVDAPSLPKGTVRAADVQVSLASAVARLAVGGPVTASTRSHAVARMADGGAVYKDIGGPIFLPPSTDLPDVSSLFDRMGAAGRRAFEAIRAAARATVPVLVQTCEAVRALRAEFDALVGRSVELPPIELPPVPTVPPIELPPPVDTGFTDGVRVAIGGARQEFETFVDESGQVWTVVGGVVGKVKGDLNKTIDLLRETGASAGTAGTAISQAFAAIPGEKSVRVPTTAPGLEEVARGVAAIPPAKYVDVQMPAPDVMAARANNVVAGIVAALDRLPTTIEIGIKTTQRGSIGTPGSATPYPAPPAPPASGGSVSTPGVGGFGIPQRTLGSPGFTFEDWGAGTLVQLHGAEAVIRQQDRMAAAITWLQAREPRPVETAAYGSAAVTQVTRDQAPVAAPSGTGDVRLELHGGIHIHMPPGTRLTPAEAEKHARAILHHLSRGGDNLTLLRRLVATAGDQ